MPATDATKFADSFSRYELGNTVSDPALLAQLTAYWTQSNFRMDVISGGRNGQALEIFFGSVLFKTLGHASSWVIGIAFKINSGNGGGLLFQLLNNSTSLFALGTNFDNTLVMYAGGNGGPVIGVSDQAIHRNVWYYAEVVVSYSGSSNIQTTGKLYVNGDVWIAQNSTNSGVNVSSLVSGTVTTNVVYMEPGIVSAGSTSFDDIYFRSGTSTRFGDVKIVGIVPDGDTAHSDWTPNSGSVHFSRVNEIPADYDTTYLSTATAGNLDIWDWQDIPSFTGTLQSVVISICARKDDEGSKAFQIVAGASGTDDVSEDFYVGDNYVYHHTGWDEIPGGGSWTRAAFNAEKWGVKVTV